MGIADSLLIHGLKVEDGLYMFICKIMLCDMAQFVYRSEIEFSALCAVQYGLAFFRVEEFSLLVEEL